MTSAQRLMFSFAPPRVALESFLIPEPAAGQILVRHSCTQVSAGTESNFLRHGSQSYGLPADTTRANIGYMAAGRVVAVGPGVNGFQVGDRVATSSGHASHALVNVTSTTAPELIPEGITDEVAGFISLGDVALHGVRRARLQIDQSAAVFGLGIVGQLVLQFARIAGAHPLIAIDVVDERLELAKRSGATHVINAASENVLERVAELTGGARAEAVFHCANTPDILQATLECAADRGTIVLTGSPPGTATIRLKEELLRRELVLTGTYESGLAQTHVYWPWNRSRNRRACLRLMAAGQVDLKHLLTHVVPAAQAPALYAQVLCNSTGWLGIVFKWE